MTNIGDVICQTETLLCDRCFAPDPEEQERQEQAPLTGIHQYCGY